MAFRAVSRRKMAAYAAEQILSGGKKSQVIDEIAAYLLEAGETREAELVVASIEEELAARGAIVATITTAHPLSSQARQKIIHKFTPKGAKMYVREKIDPSLIGGFKINLPGSQYDGTIIHKLTSLERAN